MHGREFNARSHDVDAGRDRFGRYADAELLGELLGTEPGQALRRALRDAGGLAGLVLSASIAATQRQGSMYRRIAVAVELVRRGMSQSLPDACLLDSPDTVRDFLRLGIGLSPHEVFAVIFLDAQHRLLALEEMFRGSVSQTSVYPREVVRRALELNASAVVLAHNHPSGAAEPSAADRSLTTALRDALALIDVRTLDHLVVTRQRVFSFAEAGLL